MRGMKARQIRKILGYTKDPNMEYKRFIFPRIVTIAGGTVEQSYYTHQCTGLRRLYRVAKRIYKQFGVLPQKQRD